MEETIDVNPMKNFK